MVFQEARCPFPRSGWDYSAMRVVEGKGALPSPEPNNPVERTAHSAGFVAVPGAGGCGPPLTGSVRLLSRTVKS